MSSFFSSKGFASSPAYAYFRFAVLPFTVSVPLAAPAGRPVGFPFAGGGGAAKATEAARQTTAAAGRTSLIIEPRFWRAKNSRDSKARARRCQRSLSQPGERSGIHSREASGGSGGRAASAPQLDVGSGRHEL